MNKANFVVGLLQALGIDKVDIGIGHSMGCATGVSLASIHPNFVSLYALLASCGTRAHRSLSPYPCKNW